MKESDNIEKLFKEKFEHFEADVNPQVWTNVQNSINAGAGSAASAGAKLAAGKILAGSILVAAITGSIWYFSSSEEKIVTPASKQQVQTEPVSKEETIQTVIAEDVQPVSSNAANNNNTSISMPPAIRSLNHYGSDYSVQPQNRASGNNEVVNDIPGAGSTGNASSQGEQHKYGKASEGTAGLTRGDQEQPVKRNSKTQKKNTAGENPDYEQAAVSISASTESGDWPLTVNFSNLGVSTAVSWDFGDGEYSRERDPEHKFKTPGTYTVTLVSQNSKGSNMDKVIIEVNPVSSVNHPNVFTPNGDGDNDRLDFGLKNIASIDVIISNRAGAEVYNQSTPDGSWDGKLINGNNAPEGVYYYSGQAIGTDGVVYQLRGDVTLSRKH